MESSLRRHAPGATSSSGGHAKGHTMKKLCCTLIIAGGLTGCAQIESLLTATTPPQVQSQLDNYEQALTIYDEAIRRTESQIREALEEAAAASKTADWAAAQAAFETARQLEVQHQGLVASFTKQAEQARETLKIAVTPAASGLLAVLDPLVPIPLQPLVPLASSLLVMLASSRARNHTKKAIRHTAVGNIGAAIRDTLRAVGAMHTSPGTAAVAKAEEEELPTKVTPTDPAV